MRELRAGRMIVIVDDEDRENEGDLMIAAELVTPEAINFMATHGRGLVCLTMTSERIDQLKLPPMAPNNTALGGTAFTVSIDAKGVGVTTGISAHDRARTIRAAIDSCSSPEDFARPGHVFPLRSRDGGVLERVTVSNVRMADVRSPIFVRLASRGRGQGAPGPDPLGTSNSVSRARQPPLAPPSSTGSSGSSITV